MSAAINVWRTNAAVVFQPADNGSAFNQQLKHKELN
jgi:hypothetical protein